MLGQNDALLSGQQYGPLHNVFQFADIAGPFVALEHVRRAEGKVHFRLSSRRCELFHEVIRQQGDVPAALAERGQLDGEDVQAIIEIAPECSLMDHIFQRPVGSGDQAYVRAAGFRAAQSFIAALLDDAQQFGLGKRGQISHFIQKQRAAVRLFKAAPVQALRSGKRAALVAEQFVFHQRFGQGRTVQGDEGPVRTRACRVDGQCGQFLARSAFPPQQHRGGRAGHLIDAGVDLLHGLA